MDERSAFLNALAANEDDETTRLVYADWLDEHGEHDEAARQRAWPAAKAWLVRFAEQYVIGYSELVKAAASGKGGCFGDDEGPHMVRDPKFWDCLEVVTGQKFTADHREHTYFRCAC